MDKREKNHTYCGVEIRAERKDALRFKDRRAFLLVG
jgi:hypothetical protein